MSAQEDEGMTRVLYARSANDKHIATHACKDWPSPPDPEVGLLVLIATSLSF